MSRGEKSFDDVIDLSDIVLNVKYIPMRSCLTDFDFTLSDGQVSYKGETLSSDAKAMGYKILRTRPMEHYPVGRGDMYVGYKILLKK
jgi:hypothetical protein